MSVIFMSADNAVDDSAANVDFIQSFSKLRDVSLSAVLFVFIVMMT